jgi:hypothetical protein
LVEVLFDYRPDEWYRSEMPPVPPPRELVSEKARAVLRRIGEYALQNLELTFTQRKAVALFVRDTETPPDKNG